MKPSISKTQHRRKVGIRSRTRSSCSCSCSCSCRTSCQLGLGIDTQRKNVFFWATFAIMICHQMTSIPICHAQEDISSKELDSARTNGSEPGESDDTTSNTASCDMTGNAQEESLQDQIDDSFYHPLHSDPSCAEGTKDECWSPPPSTLETEEVTIDVTAFYGGNDPSEGIEQGEEQEIGEEQEQGEGKSNKSTVTLDKHWGRDETILKMRDTLRNMGRGKGKKSSTNPHANKRPPIFLMPGLASTRLVSWRYKACSNPLLSDVKVQDYVWMNINLLLQMATLDDSCFLECMTLGLNQTDTDDYETGCKLRPDEGLDAISSLAPDSIGSNVLVGGKNTVYAWLTQWLADNLGYDVTSIIGLPYDWRLSPDVMEARDGFLTLTRRRIEAAVASNGEPGILVAHSMGNNVFRFFLEWLKNEMHEEAYARLVKQADRREMTMRTQQLRDLNNAGSSPGWVNAQAISEPKDATVEPKDATVEQKDATVEYSVTDQMYQLANSFVSSFDGLWQSYVTGVDEEFAARSDEEEIKSDTKQDNTEGSDEHKKRKHAQLWELAQAEGDDEWLEWIKNHIWTYIGLSAPLLGASNPLRAVLSGENMGLPMTEKNARRMELSFGSTHTLNPISTSTGFCDNLNATVSSKSNLACLDELIDGIEKMGGRDPWRNFPALKALLKDRVDWDTDFNPISVNFEECNPSDKPPCVIKGEASFTAKDVQSGEIFKKFNSIWKEENEPLKIKLEQLQKSWWEHPFPNLLNSTWDRPHIKHVIMSYGVDHPTEVGYIYKKSDLMVDKTSGGFDNIPLLSSVIWEEPKSYLYEEIKVAEQKTLKESVMLKKKPKRRPLKDGNNKGSLHRSGDASVPYISLAWSHTWLLHATRAMRHSRYYGMKEGDRITDDNVLDSIRVSYRPVGGSDWIEGANHKEKGGDNDGDDADDEGTSADHPHGTKYKPEMYRYQSKGKSRTTGMEYTTAVIEAVGVEHKETTRNYDILAAVFTDVLKNMHDDFDLV